ncbi:hypothetical protein CJEDD_04035 [Corynebacterium jeddahense]|uniref:Uncharacterized protein n=2 Tax=Corynebacterium jeddahense TaxID=1414719 RepID=A0ABY7UI48_9CORY|nr:hypothetical protein CJEDD_04035 [Corynebacterium jeddahense]
MKALTRLCLSTATVAALTATTIAPVVAPPAAAVENPASCLGQPRAYVNSSVVDLSDGWLANVYVDERVTTSTAPGFTAAVVSFPGHITLEDENARFPSADFYEVRYTPQTEYQRVPGYGSVDETGRPILYVFLPMRTKGLGTILIRKDGSHNLPTPRGTRSVEARLFTIPPAFVDGRVVNEFGNPEPRLGANLQVDGVTVASTRPRLDGAFEFGHVAPCVPASVQLDAPPKYSGFRPHQPVSVGILNPGQSSALEDVTMPYERGSISVVYDDNPDPSAGFPVFDVTGPAGRKTYTGYNGRLYFGNAQPGEYLITSEGTGRYSGMTLRKRVFLKPGENLTVDARYAPVSGVSAPGTATTTQVVSRTTAVTPPARTTTATVAQPVTETWTTTQVAAPTTRTETAPATTVTSTKATPATATVRLTEAVTVTPDPVTVTEVPARLTSTETTTVNRTYTTTSFRPQPLITAPRVATATSTASAPAVTRTVDVTDTTVTSEVVTATRMNTVTTTQRSTEVVTETAVVDTKGNLIAAGVALAAAALTLGGAVAAAIGAVPGLADVQKLVAPIGGK